MSSEIGNITDILYYVTVRYGNASCSTPRPRLGQPIDYNQITNKNRAGELWAVGISARIKHISNRRHSYITISYITIYIYYLYITIVIFRLAVHKQSKISSFKKNNSKVQVIIKLHFSP